MRDYKAIFDELESTLIEVGSQKMAREKIRAELDFYKHLEGKRFTDDEYYTMLVHIIFYSGFRAQTVTEKLPIIDRHFPNYAVVAEYGPEKIQAILRDPEMIRNNKKIKACVEDARLVRSIVGKHGSFQNYIDSFNAAESAANLFRLKEDLQQRLHGLGEITVYHLLTDIGMPVLKPDRVVTRIFTRLGLIESGAGPLVIIEEGRKFANATGLPIRYIDIIFVAYGQVQTKEIGLERGICLEVNPSCSICGARTICEYYAMKRTSTVS
jgi:DNA-3-methyladenine glycosylase I